MACVDKWYEKLAKEVQASNKYMTKIYYSSGLEDV